MKRIVYLYPQLLETLNEIYQEDRDFHIKSLYDELIKTDTIFQYFSFLDVLKPLHLLC